MTSDQTSRWRKIDGFLFDSTGVVIGFEEKLIQQTGWTRAMAREAIAEYRKFLLLAAEAGHPVSPSPIVDEVWHLHLLFTRSYWDELCPKVLGSTLHHEPADGTAKDREKLDDWYARTLQSYKALFDVDAPAHIWPARPVVIPPMRVDPTTAIVLPRQAVWIVVFILMTVMVVAGLIFMNGR